MTHNTDAFPYYPLLPEEWEANWVCEQLAPHLTDARRARIEEVLARRIANLCVVTQDVHNPHNISAILRTAEAFGIQQVGAIEARAPFEINLRIAQGAEQWLDIYRFSQPAAALAWLEARGFHIWAAALTEDSRPLTDCLPFPDRLALFFGNEKEGLSAEALQAAQVQFHLPMWGFTRSFNVSVAAALTLSRVLALGFPAQPLPPDRHERLRAQWYFRSVPRAAEILAWKRASRT